MPEANPIPNPSNRIIPNPGFAPEAAAKPKLLDRLRDALRSGHDSRRPEQTYCHWVKRFIFFHNLRHPGEMAEPEINAYLIHLAVKERVSASTQDQALSVLLFLYPKYPNAPKDWSWQWVFPQENRWMNPQTQEQGRHHVDESLVQKAVRAAVSKTGLIFGPSRNF